MAKEKIPPTPPIRILKENGVDFIIHHYKYQEKGGTEVAARELGIDEHLIIKTLVMEDDRKAPLIILMHGDRSVSTKAFARHVGAKSVNPCDARVAQKHTGYIVGGTSPFGTKKQLPVYIEESILSLPGILINAGRRGLLAEMTPADLAGILKAKAVNVAR
ncbi:MAG: Cys-tRNA(Pro) deacylase [Proteobacteria bacterium]|nr:Cys-tRNA(Pro) deacylase [Pseudomonadota bacterium]